MQNPIAVTPKPLNLCPAPRPPAQPTLKREGRGKRPYDLTGLRFGTWTVEAYAGRREPRNQVTWRLRCDCGAEHVETSARLKKGTAKKCRNCAEKLRRAPVKTSKYGLPEALLRRHLAVLRRLASATGRTCSLSDETGMVLLRSPCHYCGALPATVMDPDHPAHLRNGLDRVDNSGGYDANNVVPCCPACSMSRRTESQASFLERCRKIAKLHPDTSNPLTNDE